MDHENAWAGQGPVLLDIGDGVGAVVVTMPAALAGVEVEARALDQPSPGGGAARGPGHQHPGQGHHEQGHHEHGRHEHGQHEHGGFAGQGHWPHVAVVGRPVGERLVYSLVFPELLAGEYALCLRTAAEAALVVTVRDGEVTVVGWPGSAAAA